MVGSFAVVVGSCAVKPQSADRIFPIVVLCTVIFGCLVFSEGRADIQGIPKSETFRRAEYPYARVLQTCTAWRKPDQVTDTWGAVSFRSACQHHDKCFHTLGTSWSSCNRQFLIDLRESCDRDLKQAHLELGFVGDPEGRQVQSCYEIANLFHAKVQNTDVREKFRFAQEVQKRYLAHVEDALKVLFERVLRRAPTNLELVDATEALDAGMSFTDIERGLASSQRDEVGTYALQPQGHALLDSEHAGSVHDPVIPAFYVD